MRALVLSLLLSSSVAFAQHEAGEPAHHGEGHGGGEEHHGIVNWFSFDYGPNAKDPTHKDWPPPFGFALLNFAVFAGILIRFAGPGIKEFVANRHERIKRELDEAGRIRREAQGKLDELDAKLKGLDAEIARIATQVRKDAEDEKARILAAANDQAERIKVEADRQIKAEIERQRQMLSAAVVEAAITQAEQLLVKNLSAEDQRKATESYVSQLEKGNA